MNEDPRNRPADVAAALLTDLCRQTHNTTGTPITPIDLHFADRIIAPPTYPPTATLAGGISLGRCHRFSHEMSPAAIDACADPVRSGVADLTHAMDTTRTLLTPLTTFTAVIGDGVTGLSTSTTSDSSVDQAAARTDHSASFHDAYVTDANQNLGADHCSLQIAIDVSSSEKPPPARQAPSKSVPT
ncbi:hypothetical protein H257_17912 [Aphanomyces astaci]|uniref:Uncharacterized protein n=1 Tax=Aphanomyces astaci TaxID=112090 RepID=W4FER2_APHAT|nr:hypothetical protein H257_17912 [Aphanomyces astaci]ETV65311.1 hypothetical protein H257_17912 [Aphanomyces astaci]|eukprot:XP_009845177.1 hypothetical protein H257_17912 [Aphanomyces astaci]